MRYSAIVSYVDGVDRGWPLLVFDAKSREDAERQCSAVSGMQPIVTALSFTLFAAGDLRALLTIDAALDKC